MQLGWPDVLPTLDPGSKPCLPQLASSKIVNTSQKISVFCGPIFRAIAIQPQYYRLASPVLLITSRLVS